MSYYAVLEATNSLIEQRQWTLKRSRRRSDGPPRYVVFDEARAPVFVGAEEHFRQSGLTLREVLTKLEFWGDQALSVSAGHLLKQLDNPAGHE